MSSSWLAWALAAGACRLCSHLSSPNLIRVLKLPPRLVELFDLPSHGGLRESCERRIPGFDFDVLHLARTGYDELEGSACGVLALRLLKAERAGELLADAVWDETLIMRVPRGFFETMLRYVLARDVDTGGFVAKLEELQQPSLKTTAMTLAEKLIHKGRQEGQQDYILQALELRFDEVPEGLAEAIRSVGDNEKLRSLLRAAIQCASLEAFADQL